MSENDNHVIEKLESLPVITTQELLNYFAEQKKSGVEKPKVLIESGGFIDLMDVLNGYKVPPRLLRALSSPDIGLLPPPVHRTDSIGKNYYIFPDHFEQANVVLTLRYWYDLPLKAIREILKHFPEEKQHLIVNRKLSLEELLDMAKMFPRGFEVKDFVMARASDDMIQDLLPPTRALMAATEPGDKLYELEEKLVLDRLDEMKTWVKSGRMRQYLNRESAEDIRNLAQNQLIIKKIALKMKARKTRNGAHR